MRQGIKWVGLLGLMFHLSAALAVELEHSHHDISDTESLRKGASFFMNYCFSCHSMQYQSYQRVMDDLQMTESQRKAVMSFAPQAKPNDKMLNNLSASMARDAFGVVPSDLTLVAKYRGTEWVYTYLHAFYEDASRPFGVNNYLYPNVAMPHVLQPLQMTMGKEEYDQVVRDIVNFLDYSADPSQIERRELGRWVVGFLVLFLLLTLLLKKEYWRDVH